MRQAKAKAKLEKFEREIAAAKAKGNELNDVGRMMLEVMRRMANETIQNVSVLRSPGLRLRSAPKAKKRCTKS